MNDMKPPCCICGKVSTLHGYCPKHLHVRDMQVVLDTLKPGRQWSVEEVWRFLRGSQDFLSYGQVAGAVRRLWNGGFLARMPTGDKKAYLWRVV